jgi:hypothetical protein
MSFPIKVTTYSRDDVFAQHKVIFNVSNIFKTGRPPRDYVSVCNRYVTAGFIRQFHADRYHELKLTPEDLDWMKRAQLVFAQTGRISAIFADDLRRSCERHQTFMDGVREISDKWFIRSEDFSLKKSPYGIGPYATLEKILPAVLSCDKGHSCLRQTDKTKTLYFIPWITVEKQKEFRVFVYDGRVTAISQQFIGEVNPWLAGKTEEEQQEVCRKIYESHQTDFRQKLQYLGNNYVMDVALVGEEETPYFIEPNPFGAEYSSGSALFHWIFDADALEGRGEFELRYVDRK